MKLGSQSTHVGIFRFDEAPRGFKWLITTKYAAITTKYVTITHMWHQFISGCIKVHHFPVGFTCLRKTQDKYPDDLS